jgi:two-component system sensor histidine kinase CreC
MVRRLVQLASLESRTSLEKKETIGLSSLVSDELEALQSILETKQISVQRHGFDSETFVEGDPLMLRIAIRNALNNALDFSPVEGEIEIAISLPDGKPTLSVRDEGPGIPDYASGRVFDRFYSLKNEVTGRKGSGIGLSFVRATMELHGGTATLKNREKGGAEIEMSFC